MPNPEEPKNIPELRLTPGLVQLIQEQVVMEIMRLKISRNMSLRFDDEGQPNTTESPSQPSSNLSEE